MKWQWWSVRFWLRLPRIVQDLHTRVGVLESYLGRDGVSLAYQHAKTTYMREAIDAIASRPTKPA